MESGLVDAGEHFFRSVETFAQIQFAFMPLQELRQFLGPSFVVKFVFVERFRKSGCPLLSQASPDFVQGLEDDVPVSQTDRGKRIGLSL